MAGKQMEQVIAIAGKLKPSLQQSVNRANKMVNGMGAKMKKAAAVSAGATAAAGAAMATAAAAAGAAIVSVTKKAMDNYSQYEQLVGGVETLFKDSSSTMVANAQNAYKTAGMDANTYMETVTSFSAALINSLGGDTAKATQYADMAITDMADNANKMGTPLESIQQTYQSIARGNFAMLDNLKLGYGGTKAEMERLLADAEKFKAANGETVDYSIDKYSDIVDAIHVVQTEMGITGTTAREASTTIEGSVSMAKASWENWLTSLGDSNADMGATTQALIESLATAARNIIPRIGVILGSILTAVPQYLPGFLSQMGEMIGPLFEESLGACFGETGASLGASLGDMVQGIFGTLPGLIETVVSAASAFLPAFVAVLSTFAGFIADAAPLFASFFQQLTPMLTQLVSSILPPLLSVIMALMPPIMQIISALLPPLISLFTAISPIITMAASIFASLVSAVTPLVAPIMQLVQTLLPPITGLVIGVMGVLQPVIGVISGIAGAVSTLVGWISQVISLASQAANALAGIGNFVGGGIAGLLGFATGGFTQGISIAGEDPRYPTEAVISFNPAYRAQNLKYWRMAGAMLGATLTPDMPVYGFASGGFTGQVGSSLMSSDYAIAGGVVSDSTTYDLSGVTFAPQITVRGNADADNILEAIRAYEPEFIDMIISAIDTRKEAAYA